MWYYWPRCTEARTGCPFLKWLESLLVKIKHSFFCNFCKQATVGHLLDLCLFLWPQKQFVSECLDLKKVKQPDLQLRNCSRCSHLRSHQIHSPTYPVEGRRNDSRHLFRPWATSCSPMDESSLSSVWSTVWPTLQRDHPDWNREELSQAVTDFLACPPKGEVLHVQLVVSHCKNLPLF